MTNSMAERGFRGLRVVPVSMRKKACLISNSNKLYVSLPEVPRYFNADSNVGIVLRPLSGELVNVDVDCDEALTITDIYLPATRAQFGRVSRPRFHRLCHAPGAAFEAFADPQLDRKNTAVELHALGRDGGAHQVPFPLSLTDSEKLGWLGDAIASPMLAVAALRIELAWLEIWGSSLWLLSCADDAHRLPDRR